MRTCNAARAEGVNEFYSVCKRRKLKVNAGKSKVMMFERREEEVIDFNRAYK